MPALSSSNHTFQILHVDIGQNLQGLTTASTTTLFPTIINGPNNQGLTAWQSKYGGKPYKSAFHAQMGQWNILWEDGFTHQT